MVHMNNSNCIYGWDFSEETKKKYMKSGKLLMLDFELGPDCKLKCGYCFRTGDERDKGDYMTIEEVKDVIVQAASRELEVKSIHIVGQGYAYSLSNHYNNLTFHTYQLTF